MAANHDVVENFVKKNRESSKGFSMVFRDNRLFSYDTCIAEWMKDGTLLVNRTKYSEPRQSIKITLCVCFQGIRAKWSWSKMYQEAHTILQGTQNRIVY